MINHNPCEESFKQRLNAITASESNDTREYGIASAIVRHNAVLKVIDRAVQSCRNEDISPAKHILYEGRLARRFSSSYQAFLMDEKLYA